MIDWNPIEGNQISFYLNGFQSEIPITIYDVSGKFIRKYILQSGQTVVSWEPFAKGIYLLASHGLIVESEDLSIACDITYNLNKVAKNYLKKHIKNFKCFKVQKQSVIDERFLYADDVMFLGDENKPNRDEIVSAHNFIVNYSKLLDDTRFLTDEHIDTIRNLESEKYRRSL